MKVMRIRLDSFVAPFQSGGQEPRQRQHDPPYGRRRTKEIRHHKQYGTPFVVVRALTDQILLVARYVISEQVSNQVGHGNHQITQRQEYDRSFRISKAVGVDGECQRREQAGHGAQYGPQGHPRPGVMHLFLAPERVTRHAAILDHSVADFQRVTLVVPVLSLPVNVGVDHLELFRANEPDVVTAGHVPVSLVAGRIVSGAERVFDVGRVDDAGVRRMRRGGHVVLADAQLVGMLREL